MADALGLRLVERAPDTILHGGNVVTVDPEQPRAEALAVKDGRLLAVGPSAAVLALAGPGTWLIDLGGRTVIPGLNDPHNHMLSTGAVLAQVQLYDARSIRDIQSAVTEAAARAEPGTWILGRGWNEILLDERRSPTRWDLDAAAPHHPVVLDRVWNMLAANSAALAAAGIDRSTPDPDPRVPYSGRIDRDHTGEPTGILRDRAKQLIYRAIPPRTAEEREAHLRLACAAYNRLGITSIADPGLLPAWFAAYQNVHRAGDLTVRASLCPAGWGSTMEPKPADIRQWLTHLALSTGFGDEWLRLDAVKFMPDGGVGDRTAYQYQPYRDEPDNFGQAIVPEAELHDHVRWCHARGWSIDMHVCGDRSQDIAVRAFAAAYAAQPDARSRHRVHHGYLPTAEALALMREHRIAALATIPFLYTMGESFVASLGEARAARMMPLRTYLEAGVPLAGASDSPVAIFDPFAGIYAAVTRRTQLGQELGPEERISREEALRLYTAAGAWSTFEEDVKGTLTPGKLADLAVLDRDVLTCPEAEILLTRPVLTLVGGRVVYSAD